MLNFIVNSYVLIYKSILPLVPVAFLLIVYFCRRKLVFDLKIIIVTILLFYSYIPLFFYNQAQQYLSPETLDIDSAIKKRELSAKLSINPFTKNMIYNNVAILNFRIKNYEGADIARKNAIRIINNQDFITTLLISKGYSKNRNYDEAIKILINKKNQETDYKNKMVLNDLLSNVYMDAKAYSLAFNSINEALRIYNAHQQQIPFPCGMIKKRITIEKTMKTNRFIKKDEDLVQTYCNAKF